MDFGKIGYTGDERDVTNDRSWERFAHIRNPQKENAAKYPVSILGYTFDDQYAGHNVAAVTNAEESTSTSYKEKLEDNETVIGFRVLYDHDNYLADVAFKKAVMPSATSSPISSAISLTGYNSVKFSSNFTEANFIESLLSAKLPLSDPHPLLNNYGKAAIDFIINNFHAKSPSAEYAKAQRLLTWLAGDVTRNELKPTDSC